jgi:PA14 domain
MNRKTLFRALAAAAMALGGWLSVPSAHAAAPAQSTNFWLGEYFNNTDLAGQPVLLRATRNVVFNWGTGSPGRAVRRDNWSARWTRPIQFADGVYRIRVTADDGVRVYVDNNLVINDWTDGSSRERSTEQSLSGLRVIRVEYYERFDRASIRLSIESASTPAQSVNAPVWRAEYFANTSLSGAPVSTASTIGAVLNFDWGQGAPAARVPVDNWSARFTSQVQVDRAGTYRVTAVSDDGVRVFLNDRLVLDNWSVGAPREANGSIRLDPGSYAVRVEFFDAAGGARLNWRFLFEGDAPPPAPTPIPQTFPDWKAEYYGNPDLSGSPAATLNDASPGSAGDFLAASRTRGAVGNENISVRWSRTLTFASGVYRLRGRVDDGVRVFVNGRKVLDDWRDASVRDYSVDVELNGTAEIRIEYYNRGGTGIVTFSIDTVNAVGSGWRGEYFNNATLSGAPVLTRNEANIDFDYGSGSPDPARVPVDNFSARWTRTYTVAPATYRFRVTVDDGVRVFVNNQIVVDQFVEGGPRVVTGDLFMGGQVEIRVEYFDRGGSGQIRFNFEPVQPAPTPAP